jgi:asparagine synthase (glutamine-hydrolysing)
VAGVSGIAAVVYGDGRSCTPADLDPMLAAAAHRGPSGRLAWVSGPAGLGHLHLDSGLFRPSCRQPLAGRDGLIALTFDGRLDNRAELAAEIGTGDPDRGALSDPELVLAAYRALGEGCAARLLGDFAFVLWDGERRRLLAARDALGTRTLFYYWDGSLLLLGSEIGQLLAHPAARVAPDEGAVADLVRLRFQDVERTFHKGVRRMPPAHFLTLGARNLSLRRYWQAPAEPRQDTLGGTDYAERFRELFEEAVRCRIRSSRPVACLFSGGVDSSSALSMAHAVSGPEVHAGLKAFSMVFKQAPVDDRPYIQHVVDRYGTDVHYCEVPRVGPVRNLDRMVQWTGSPWVDVHHPVVTTLMAEARRQDCGVVLTGLRGDDIFAGLGQLADLTRRLRLGRALAEFEAWVTTTGWRRPRLAWQLCLRPLARPPRPPFRTYAAQDVHEATLGTFTTLTTELFETMAARHGLEPVYPFWDRRLVEFVLTVPPELRASGGVTKRLLRQALAGVVPEPNLERRDKLSLAPQVRRGLLEYDRGLVLDRLATMHPVVERQVGRKKVDRMLADLFGGLSGPSLVLWFAICANVWLHRLEGAPSTRETSPKALIEGGLT